MNILIACDTYPPNVNGAATFTANLASGLAARGHRVGVMAPSATGKASTEEHDGVTIYRSFSFPVPTFQEFRYTPLGVTELAARRVIETFKPEIVHAQSYFGLSNAAISHAVRRNISTVGTNHAMPENLVHYYHLPPLLERQLVRLGWFHVAKVFDKVDIITSPTASAAALLQQKGFSRPVRPISNGIDLQRFRPGKNKYALRSALHLPLHLPIFLTVGRLVPEKQLDRVIRGFTQSLRSRPAHLVIAGSGQELHRLQALSYRLGSNQAITFAGFVPDNDLPSLYGAVDAFISAGTAELQSIVTLEAMASSLPIIAANSIALPELVSHQKNGFLFEQEDINQLASHISLLAASADLRQQFGQQSLAAVQPHSMDSVLEQFETTYAEALISEQSSTDANLWKQFLHLPSTFRKPSTQSNSLVEEEQNDL